MKARYFALLLSVFALVAAAPAAQAAIGFSAQLSGAAENPPNGSPATGMVQVILNDAETMISWHVEFSGLTAAETGAHFHAPACQPNLNAGVIIGLPLGSPKDGTSPVTAQQVQWLKDGCVYLNIHSQNFPGGEIRGNLKRDDAVPTETSTWGRLKVIYR